MLGEICLPFCVLLKVKWVSIIMFPISDNEKIILHSDKKIMFALFYTLAVELGIIIELYPILCLIFEF